METIIVGFVSGVITGIMLLAGTCVFVLPKLPNVIHLADKNGPPSGWFDRLLWRWSEHHRRKLGRSKWRRVEQERQ